MSRPDAQPVLGSSEVWKRTQAYIARGVVLRHAHHTCSDAQGGALIAGATLRLGTVRTFLVSFFVYRLVRCRAFSSSMFFAMPHIWLIIPGQLISIARCSRSG